jgi:hypothetical protein
MRDQKQHGFLIAGVLIRVFDEHLDGAFGPLLLRQEDFSAGFGSQRKCAFVVNKVHEHVCLERAVVEVVNEREQVMEREVDQVGPQTSCHDKLDRPFERLFFSTVCQFERLVLRDH